MAGSLPNQDVFDVRKVRRLVVLMKEHDLTELEIQQGETRIQLRRGAAPVVSTGAAAPVAAAPVAPAPGPADKPEAAAPSDEHLAVIRSPMVGTFYTAPDPESPTYVKVGDHVGPETTVCTVEAMKVFNQIPAEVTGKIVAVLVDNGETVEFNQPLFKVDTRG
ncbi:MAG: acetyl-CoA carboxylase biotin carboxyl carrier protein [Thermoguttaceae bacterium]|jgi:acetyl-CoA carboxylase biotin carboxyl carrier protein|nr:acetyl-CoA carboxylase biotin carboxyl carrier protein [Thermoguttaceae bacterium]